MTAIALYLLVAGVLIAGGYALGCLDTAARIYRADAADSAARRRHFRP